MDNSSPESGDNNFSSREAFTVLAERGSHDIMIDGVLTSRASDELKRDVISAIALSDPDRALDSADAVDNPFHRIEAVTDLALSGNESATKMVIDLLEDRYPDSSDGTPPRRHPGSQARILVDVMPVVAATRPDLAFHIADSLKDSRSLTIAVQVAEAHPELTVEAKEHIASWVEDTAESRRKEDRQSIDSRIYRAVLDGIGERLKTHPELAQVVEPLYGEPDAFDNNPVYVAAVARNNPQRVIDASYDTEGTKRTWSRARHTESDALLRVADAIAEVAPEQAKALEEAATMTTQKVDRILLNPDVEQIKNELMANNQTHMWERAVLERPELIPFATEHIDDWVQAGGKRDVVAQCLISLGVEEGLKRIHEWEVSDDQKVGRFDAGAYVVALLSQEAISDPIGALKLAEEEGINRSTIAPIIAKELVATDPSAAEKLLFPEDKKSEPHSGDGNYKNAFAELVTDRAKSNPAEALKLMEAYKGNGRYEIYARIAGDVPEAAEVVLRSIKTDRFSPHVELLETLARSSPQHAPEMINLIAGKERPGYKSLDEQREEKRLQEKIVDIVRDIADRDPVRALECYATGAATRLYRFTEDGLPEDQSFIDRSFELDKERTLALVAEMVPTLKSPFYQRLIQLDPELAEMAAAAFADESTYDYAKGFIPLTDQLIASGRKEDAQRLISQYLTGPEGNNKYREGTIAEIALAHPELMEIMVSELIAKDDLYSLAKLSGASESAKNALYQGFGTFMASKQTHRAGGIVSDVFKYDAALAGTLSKELHSTVNSDVIPTELLGGKADPADVQAFVENLGSNDRKIELLVKILRHYPDLTEYARTYAEPTQSFRPSSTVTALKVEIIKQAAITGQDREGREVYSELVGAKNLLLDKLATTDRSINFNLLTADDIEKNPDVVSILSRQMTSPAQIKAFLGHLDRLAGDDLELKAGYLRSALNQKLDFELRYRDEKKTQADGGSKANHDLYRQMANYRALISRTSNRSGTLSESLKKGYGLPDLFEHPWLLDQTLLAEGVTPFPVESNSDYQARWLADNAFVKLQGYNRGSIGKIISNRLSAGLEGSVHDATQWMSTFDVQRDSDKKYRFNPETGKMQKVKLVDRATEFGLIKSLSSGERLTPEELKSLPGYESTAEGKAPDLNKIASLFSTAQGTAVYAATLMALRKYDGAPTTQDVMGMIEANGQLIQDWVGRSKETIVSSDLVYEARSYFGQTYFHTSGIHKVDAIPARQALPQLRAVGKARKEYIDGATSWLRRYQNLDANTLQVAWKERPFALEEGIDDDPATIVAWSKSNGFNRFVRSMADDEGNLPDGTTSKEFTERHSSFISPLVSRYDSGSVFEALQRLDRERNLAANLPAATIDLGDGFTYRISAKDEPDGMIVGHDTQCCMTLGGASESCIYAGYSDPRFGFGALYEHDELVAQSFIWHNEDRIVLDNIEAQRGRSLSNIALLTQRAYRAYISGLAEKKPELGIQAVNLGTRYTESSLLDGLKKVDPTPVPDTGAYLYSDARTQRELVHLEEGPIDEIIPAPNVVFDAPAVKPEKVHISAEYPTLDASPGLVAMVNAIERQVYPEALQYGAAMMQAELSGGQGASFLINRREGTAGAVGYVIAYPADEALYVSDMAILPEQQRNGYGFLAFGEICRRAEALGLDRIVFDARETTSYQALGSDTAKEFFSRSGFVMTEDTELEGYYGDESAHHIVLVRR